jgi:hypothetical protein
VVVVTACWVLWESLGFMGCLQAKGLTADGC